MTPGGFSPPPTNQAQRQEVRFGWFIVEPSREDLSQIGALLDAGQVRPIVDKVFPLAEARQAFEAGSKGHARGKIVLTVSWPTRSESGRWTNRSWAKFRDRVWQDTLDTKERTAYMGKARAAHVY